MLRQRDNNDSPIPVSAFTAFNKEIFFNEDVPSD
jgi:hypothetical protein